ncbi:MAG: type I methionyl aminopeptidase [Patescibacteria group bacterium]
MAILKSEAEIKVMAEGGRILAEILEILKKETRAGITTNHLDELSLKLIKESGAKPAFLNYHAPGSPRSYPKTLCASLNEVVVHGVPSERIIQEGDLVKIDLGLVYQNFYLDSARTVYVGKPPKEIQKLIAITEEALALGIKIAHIGKTLGDIGHAISNCVTQNGFSIVGSLTGHGIGRNLHEDPTVFNFGRPGQGEELKEGMVIAIEPMVSASKGKIAKVKEMPDGGFATADGSFTAHFEHTVAITSKGPQILTRI